MNIKLLPAYDSLQEVASLFSEYTDMLVAGDAAFQEYLDIQNFNEEIKHLEAKYGLPYGRLYLAYCDGQPAGCIGLRKIDDQNCEMKRLYVRPAFRGRQIGNCLVRQIIADAKEIGYAHMLLDTLPFLQNAIRMYERYGFYEIPSYNDSPLAASIYMKLDLLSEREKMLRGDPYDPSDKELTQLRTKAHRLSQLYNTTLETEEAKRREILDELLPNRGGNCYLQGPVQFDYGVFTTVGDNFYANFNLVILDICPVTIGDNVLFGPNCTVAAAMHSLNPAERRMKTREDGSAYDIEFGKPVTIGNDCWIASNVVICGGVTIGDNCVIGAGSVVTRDIPANSLAAGNPCRVIRRIAEQ